MPRRFKDFHFDEAVADSLAPNEKIKEEPIKSLIFKGVWISSLLISILALIRIFFLGGLQGSYYAERALANVRQELPIIAPRGIILDRRGIPLVENKTIFSAFLRLDEMIKRDERDKVSKATEEILSINLNEKLADLEPSDLENYLDYLVAEDISPKQAIDLRSLNLSSLRVEDDYKRSYRSNAFTHIVGYVGRPNKYDLSKNKKLNMSDSLGKAGLEVYYDDILRGENGKKLVYKNTKGEVQKIEKGKDIKIGQVFKTTIDAGFQEYFYSRLHEGLRRLERTSGVGIAINPGNGEVLALVSFPTYDPTKVSKFLNDPTEPLFNRAVAGVYNPGSTIKPIHAVAALKEGVVDAKKQIFSAGFIELPNPFDPSNPSRFLDWRPHGWVDLYSAIARSSNVYFYEVGGGFEGLKGLGIDRLITYWQKFGLDRKTGIDLPSESIGFLPNPDEKEKRTGTIWRIGDTYNVSIGQGDVAVTPLGLLNAISVIGNGGKAFQLHIAQLKDVKPILDLSDLEPQFKEVRKGMEDAVSKPYGTASLLSDLPVKVAAKTGSAQTANNTKTNALFVGYTPSQNPQIAVLVLIENAREGSLNAVPIAKDVLRWYYENRMVSNR